MTPEEFYKNSTLQGSQAAPSSIVTPEQYFGGLNEEWRKSSEVPKPASSVEALYHGLTAKGQPITTMQGLGRLVPFSQSLYGILAGSDYKAAVEHIRDGVATLYDEALVRKSFELQEQLPDEERASFSYNLGNMLGNTLPWMGEFVGAGLAFKPAAALTRAALGRAAATTLRGRAAVWLGGAVGQTIAQPTRIVENMIERRTPQISLQPGEKGELSFIVSEATDEEFWPALCKAMGETYIDTASEYFGEIPGRAVGYLKAGIIKNWLKRGAKTGVKRTPGMVAQLYRAAGWNGILGEMSEERLAELLKPTLFVTEHYVPPTGKQLLTEAVMFSLLGGAGKVADIGTEKVRRAYFPTNWERVAKPPLPGLVRIWQQEPGTDIWTQSPSLASDADLKVTFADVPKAEVDRASTINGREITYKPKKTVTLEGAYRWRTPLVNARRDLSTPGKALQKALYNAMSALPASEASPNTGQGLITKKQRRQAALALAAIEDAKAAVWADNENLKLTDKDAKRITIDDYYAKYKPEWVGLPGTAIGGQFDLANYMKTAYLRYGIGQRAADALVHELAHGYTALALEEDPKSLQALVENISQRLNLPPNEKIIESLPPGQDVAEPSRWYGPHFDTRGAFGEVGNNVFFSKALIEQIALDAERYVQLGIAPNQELQKAFTFLGDMYKDYVHKYNLGYVVGNQPQQIGGYQEGGPTPEGQTLTSPERVPQEFMHWYDSLFNYQNPIRKIESLFDYTVAESAKDSTRLAAAIFPVFQTLGNDKQARLIAYKIYNARATMKEAVERSITFVNSISKGLTEADVKAIEPMLQQLIDADQAKAEDLKASNPKVYNAAIGLRRIYDDYLTRIKAHIKNELIESQDDQAMKDALRAVVEGQMPVADAVAYYKLDEKTDAKRLASLAEEYSKIDSWGLKDYFTNMTVGSYRLLDDDGKVRVIATTRKTLAERTEQYVRGLITHGKAVPRLYLDNMLDSATPASLAVNNDAYFSIRNRLAAALGVDLAALNKALKPLLSTELKLRRPFISPTSKRFGAAFVGSTNALEKFKAYTLIIERRLAFDSVSREVEKTLPNLMPNNRKVVRDQYEAAIGREYWDTKAVDEMFRWLDLEPGLLSRAAAIEGAAQATIKIGYRPVMAMVNAIFGVGHTYVDRGAISLWQGYKFIQTNEGKKLLSELALHIPSHHVIDPEGNLHTSRKVYSPLYLFNLAEVGSRKLALATNYIYIKSHAEEFELSPFDEDGIRREAVISSYFQEFMYDLSLIGSAFRSPTGRILGRFKQYPIQEALYIARIAKSPAKLARYLGLFWAVGGTSALIATLKGFIGLGFLFDFDELEKWFDNNLPAVVHRGIPGALGVDITAAVTLRVPQTLLEAVGPTVSDVVKFYTKVIKPIAVGEGYQPEAVGEWVKGSVVMLPHVQKAIDAMFSEDGAIKDRQGNVLYHTDSDLHCIITAGKNILGATPLEEARIRLQVSIAQREIAIKRVHKRRTADEIVKRLLSGDKLPDWLLDEVAQFEVGKQSIDGAIERATEDKAMRLFMRSGLSTRADLLPMVEELYGEEEQ